MSLLLQMIAGNVPLYRWREYEKSVGGSVHYSGWSLKNPENVARIIVNSLSNSEVVELVAREFDSLPSLVRMALTNECNIARGENRSGNKNKGIGRLNERLGGRVLREIDTRPTERRLESWDGKLVSVDRRLNPAVIGATRAYANYVPPSSRPSPKERRKLRKEMRKQRKEG